MPAFPFSYVESTSSVTPTQTIELIDRECRDDARDCNKYRTRLHVEASEGSGLAGSLNPQRLANKS